MKDRCKYCGHHLLTDDPRVVHGCDYTASRVEYFYAHEDCFPSVRSPSSGQNQERT